MHNVKGVLFTDEEYVGLCCLIAEDDAARQTLTTSRLQDAHWIEELLA